MYPDLPEAGMITGVTYGLSCADHPEWRFGRPEFVVTVSSRDEAWPLAAAWLGERFRGEPIQKIGVATFWDLEGFDPYDVGRRDLSEA